MARKRATDTAALVAAAAETFRLKGYRNATIGDIADAAGISRPTVYQYTRSKQSLLDLMVDDITGDLTRRQLSIMESDLSPRVRLSKLISAHVESTVANRTFYAIVWAEEIELSEDARLRFRSWAHALTRDFRELLEEGLPAGSPVDPTIAANLILSMLSTLYRWYDPSGPVSPTALADQVETMVSVFFAVPVS
jgi:TetR/AcrR family transcriptional regulator, cholesterol catabolism regulator